MTGSMVHEVRDVVYLCERALSLEIRSMPKTAPINLCTSYKQTNSAMMVRGAVFQSFAFTRKQESAIKIQALYVPCAMLVLISVSLGVAANKSNGNKKYY